MKVNEYMRANMNINTKPSFLNGFMQNIIFAYKSTNNPISLSEIKTVHLPDELVDKIFELLSGQIRLSIFPQVCRQYRKISLSFSDKCFQLHHFIPKIRELMMSRGLFERCTRLFVINFDQNQGMNQGVKQSVSLNTIRLGVYEEKDLGLSSKTLGIHLNPFRNFDDSFDIIEFGEQLENFAALNTQYSPRIYSIQHNTISPDNSVHTFNIADQCGVDLVSLLSNLNDRTLTNIIQVLTAYSQGVLLRDNHDLADLKNKLLSTLTRHEKKQIERILDSLNIDGWIRYVSLSKFDRDQINETILSIASHSLKKSLRLLKEKIETWSIQYERHYSYKKSLFFLNQKSQEGLLSTYTIEQLFMSTCAEYQWFAGKII